MRTDLGRIVAGVLLVSGSLVVAPRAAGAGPLGKVIEGLGRATGGDDDKREEGGGRSDSGDRPTVRDHRSSDDGSLGSWDSSPHTPRHPTDDAVVGGFVVAPPPTTADTSLYLYLGAQAVEGSDGAMSLEMRAIHDAFGLGLRGTQFYERQPAGEYLHLDLWAFTGGWRVWDGHERGSVWVEGGLGGLSASGDLDLVGAHAGVRLERPLVGEIRAGAEARLFWLQDHVFANEASASLHVWIMRISYRYVDFNVGPPLKGPEVGLALAF